MVWVPGLRLLKPPAEPPAEQAVAMDVGVVVLVISQLPSDCWTASLPLDATADEPADFPSNTIVTMSPAFTDDGRCALTVNVTGLEQLSVDGVNVIADFELMFRKK